MRIRADPPAFALPTKSRIHGGHALVCAPHAPTIWADFDIFALVLAYLPALAACQARPSPPTHELVIEELPRGRFMMQETA